MIEEGEEEEEATGNLAEIKEFSGWTGWYFLINRGARNGSGSLSRWGKNVFSLLPAGCGKTLVKHITAP